ncbi:N,N-dimethylformamidase beta subunit family domain-containing protein [Streptomyces sp. NPDC006975]|uniref:N,N-dimethylformamidase beta subunit family domain-containing protein n=1 Tax=Streptomyces sp. NPDC006975 TaxID=3154310 RepID=UPI003455332E
MSELSRRTVLRAAGVTAAVAGGVQGVAAEPARALPAPRTGDNPVVRENRAPGSDDWCVGRRETRGVSAGRPEIQGYATTASVAPGETLGLRLSSRVARTCTVEIYRLGHYDGVRARHLLTAADVPVDRVWRTTVPGDWVSGIFLAVLTTAGGFRSYAPFVVRDPARVSDVLVVVPLGTTRAAHPGLGLPEEFGTDTSASRWLEAAGYDVTYATEEDLHAGRVAADRHTAVVLAGAAASARRPGRTRAAVGRAPGATVLSRPLRLSEPGHVDDAARRAAARHLDRVLTAATGTPGN